VLYIWSSPNKLPGDESSNLIKTDNEVPINAEKDAKIRYKVPISL